MPATPVRPLGLLVPDRTRRELNAYLKFYNHDRVPHGRLTGSRIPADIVYVPAKWRPDEPRLSAHSSVRRL
jgi:hypothetical protein